MAKTKRKQRPLTSAEAEANRDRLHEIMVIERAEAGDPEGFLRILEDRSRKAIANPQARMMRPRAFWRNNGNAGEGSREAT